ncbi:surfeit 5 [Penaeus vannamei]|uniref:Mediator of RNA polymerase II transcription subunit 22 n=2 Tax=Penaeus vannamei TaxID=6689 RepID=A0A423TG18_PENVA|nr:surfeit 5 [Penaeus vannamei]
MSLATHKINERLQRDRGEERECRLVWTINMEEMLIYFVRGNRMLWDPTHPSFAKLAMKKRRVEDIAALLKREVGPEEAFAVTAENVWKKFRSMRLFFLREVKKVHDSRSNIGDDGYTSTWAHYNRMRFLLQSLRPKENQDSDHPRHISVLGADLTVSSSNSDIRTSAPTANDSSSRCEASTTRQPNGVNVGLAKYETPSASQPRVTGSGGIKSGSRINDIFSSIQNEVRKSGPMQPKMAQQGKQPQGREALLKSYNKRLKDDVKSILDNFMEIVKLGVVEDESQVNRMTQVEEIHFQMQVRSSNMVRAAESLMKLVADVKQYLILNDFPSVNEAITQNSKIFKSKSQEADQKLMALRDDMASDLYELEEEFYSSVYKEK